MFSRYSTVFFGRVSTTTPTVTWNVPIDTPFYVIMEIANADFAAIVDRFNANLNANSATNSVSTTVAGGDMGIGIFGQYLQPQGSNIVPAQGWKKLIGDRQGVNEMHYIFDAPAGTLTASVGNSVAVGGSALSVIALGARPGGSGMK